MDSDHEWNNYLLHLSSHIDFGTFEITNVVTTHGDGLRPQIFSIHTHKGVQGLQH